MGKSIVSALASAFAPRTQNLTQSLVPSNRGWFGTIGEPFAGAWSRTMEVDAPQTILGFSAVFRCVTGIATDIAKLAINLMEEDSNQIGVKVERNSPYWPVLRKPNRFQTLKQFIEQWVFSLLLYGNTYVLKSRDARGIVVAMYVLNPQRVKVLVTDEGGVYYELAADFLSGMKEKVVCPASEMIHDRINAIWHPLVGLSPLYACAMSATMGNRIQSNSTIFFGNMSRPSGVLSAPGEIKKDTAERLKGEWENNFGAGKIGRTAVLGDGLKYEAMAMPADDAQLIEQLKWTVEDVARAFGYPLYKLGGPVPSGSSVESLNQGYYSECLQSPIESIEGCLDEGLGLTEAGYWAELDLQGLMRMDWGSMVKWLTEAVKGTLMTPNEGRRRMGLPPMTGGDALYKQQQDFSLAALAKRDAQADPFAKPGTPALPAPPADDEGAADEEMVAALAKEFRRGLALPHVKEN